MPLLILDVPRISFPPPHQSATSAQPTHQSPFTRPRAPSYTPPMRPTSPFLVSRPRPAMAMFFPILPHSPSSPSDNCAMPAVRLPSQRPPSPSDTTTTSSSKAPVHQLQNYGNWTSNSMPKPMLPLEMLPHLTSWHSPMLPSSAQPCPR